MSDDPFLGSEMEFQTPMASSSRHPDHDAMDSQATISGMEADEAASETPAPAEEPVERKPAPTAANFERHALNDFAKLLQRETRQATFACGGTIPILLTPEGPMKSGELTPVLDEKFNGMRMTARSVALRWGKDQMGRQLTLPVLNDEEGVALQQLVEGCEPATFGRGGEDVYDESYRRAGALGVDDFMTNFCPYQAGLIGIIDQYFLHSVAGELEPSPPRSKVAEKYDLSHDQETNIHAAILRNSIIQPCLEALQVAPSITKETSRLIERLDQSQSGLAKKADLVDLLAQRLKTRDGEMKTFDIGPNDPKRRMLSRGNRAELYKLNVCSGPSGMFKAHVDTPRSDMQTGSLVVCLPVPFEGGALAVRHSGREVVYKWGIDKPAIRWAAFYSDCQHEVLEVTSGHRVTLTYNLFLAPGTGLLTGAMKCLDPPSLPLYGHLRKALTTKQFFPKGGYLGFHLAHSYPHTHERLHQFVASMLNGSDMALYEVAMAMGLVVALEATSKANLPSEAITGLLNNAYEQHRRSRRPLDGRFTSNLQAHTVRPDWSEGEGDDS
ncbi:uncharacterized protein LTR77_004420 [Saxophila tyrrhenica]|uniref:Prolyl 4-hydroxylase alpha subunit Fe(2+) 2OG dioxygenase domain-containing protein n=1 Tax=Saxophila tyrrhenica TaxID=1690608 RepID=A0AAV9PDJ8_9PEZI|nr:hypothetical protein LTR77_004420 [Saxophila tyrrhenica]